MILSASCVQFQECKGLPQLSSVRNDLWHVVVEFPEDVELAKAVAVLQGVKNVGSFSPVARSSVKDDKSIEPIAAFAAKCLVEAKEKIGE